MCPAAVSRSAGGGGVFMIEIALDRVGTGVGGDVESLAILFIGERYPLKLLERWQNGGAVTAFLSR